MYVIRVPRNAVLRAQAGRPEVSFEDFVRLWLAGDARWTRDDEWAEAFESAASPDAEGGVVGMLPGDDWLVSDDLRRKLYDVVTTFQFPSSPTSPSPFKADMMGLVRAITSSRKVDREQEQAVRDRMAPRLAARGAPGKEQGGG